MPFLQFIQKKCVILSAKWTTEDKAKVQHRWK